MFKKNIRSTVLGIAMILSAVGSYTTAYLDSDPATVTDYKVTAVAIAAGWGLIVMREQAQSDKENK